jgi:DNA-binding NtrC family response regulator
METASVKIFLVDDDVFSLNMTEQHIRNLGYEQVTTFSSGTDCLNNLDKKPDVIFLDHNMDVLNGFEVLKKIKRVDPNTYVVMFSGQENLKTAVDSLKFGAFDYIIKGEDEAAKIADVLQRICNVQEMLKKSKPNFLRMLFSII